MGARFGRGYGAFKVGGQMRRATRVALQLAGREVPVDRIVLHACDNPCCVNPSHLVVGTHAENMRDRNLKLRFARQRFAPADIHAIRASEDATKVLAARYRVTVETIRRIRKGLRWAHLSGETSCAL